MAQTISDCVIINKIIITGYVSIRFFIYYSQKKYFSNSKQKWPK